MLVVDVFPFRTDTGLEKVIVGFLGELVSGCDVVLLRCNHVS